MWIMFQGIVSDYSRSSYCYFSIGNQGVRRYFFSLFRRCFLKFRVVREVDFSFDFFFGIVSLEDDDGVYEFILI